MRAATYARLSDDGLSIPDQQASARRYAQDRGWEVVAEFKDAHRSAFRPVERKGFEAMLASAAAGDFDVIVARHQDRLTRHPESYSQLLKVCVQHGVTVHLYTGGVLDLATSHGGFMGMISTAVAWQESAIRSERVKAAIQRNVTAGRRTGGGTRPFGYRVIKHDTGGEGRRRYRIVREELEPAEAELVREAAARVLRGETLRRVAMDWRSRGVKTVSGRDWSGGMLRRMLLRPRLAGLREHHGQVILGEDGDPVEASWPAIISREEHDRLVGLLKDPSRRPASVGRPRSRPLSGLVYCESCGGKLVSSHLSGEARGYGCRSDENPVCKARVRIAAEPLEEYVAGYVIEMWRNPKARKIAQSDGDRMARIRETNDEMARIQEQRDEALEMRLSKEVDPETYRRVMRRLDARHDQLEEEHSRLTSEASMPELPDPKLGWDSLSAEDRRALTEMLVDRVVISQHPHEMVETADGGRKRSYTIRAIPYRDHPDLEAARLKAVHEARVKIVPRV